MASSHKCGCERRSYLAARFRTLMIPLQTSLHKRKNIPPFIVFKLTNFFFKFLESTPPSQRKSTKPQLPSCWHRRKNIFVYIHMYTNLFLELCTYLCVHACTSTYNVCANKSKILSLLRALCKKPESCIIN